MTNECSPTGCSGLPTPPENATFASCGVPGFLNKVRLAETPPGFASVGDCFKLRMMLAAEPGPAHNQSDLGLCFCWRLVNRLGLHS